MKVAAIITEYNPFHNGHKYQIDELRRTLGEDTAIIAIMSGNYTQRGEIAVADKTERAKAAVLSGVNLVLELPFPFFDICSLPYTIIIRRQYNSVVKRFGSWIQRNPRFKPQLGELEYIFNFSVSSSVKCV